MKIPFACVATDVRGGQEIIIREGPVWKATRASASLPLLVSTAKFGDRFLVDGAVLNPVPVRVVKEMGAGFVIAVNVSPDQYVHEVPNPSIFAVLAQLIHLANHQILEHSLEGADVVIQPDTVRVGFGRLSPCRRMHPGGPAGGTGSHPADSKAAEASKKSGTGIAEWRH